MTGEQRERLDNPTLREILRRHGAAEDFDALLAERDALAAALEEIVRRHPRGCGVIYSGQPKGWTCLDTLADAAKPESRYGDDYRASILAGEHVCDVCVARRALAAAAAVTGRSKT